MGIAALVAINTFSENLQYEINDQAKSLLGADLEIEGTLSDSQFITKIHRQIGGDYSKVTSFASMVYFPRSGGARLAQIKAFEGSYPYFGTVNTEPKAVFATLQENKSIALLDKTLMLQFDLHPGDSVKVGELTFPIAGAVVSVPGRAGLAASIAPAVYISLSQVAATGLLQKGSRVENQHFFKVPASFDTDGFIKQIEPQLDSLNLGYDTVEGRKEGTGEAFENMADFLNLVAFIALLLGCIGVASAVHLYIKDKIPVVAVLRCMGASGNTAFAIFLVQIAVIGLLGAIAGAALGSILQTTLPLVAKDFLPIEQVRRSISWYAIGQGILTGFIVSLLFSLPPLLKCGIPLPCSRCVPLLKKERK